MDNFTATEIAYKNGYEQGKKDAVVHGQWLGVHQGWGICSNCHRVDGIDKLATHCRYCGAKMDLEE
jgi:hypothetical protein